jgi:Arc/MetJ-type ribon-helix-helix transcriptional regulator
VKKIGILVEAGRFNSSSDFVRRAVAEKLENVEVREA